MNCKKEILRIQFFIPCTMHFRIYETICIWEFAFIVIEQFFSMFMMVFLTKSRMLFIGYFGPLLLVPFAKIFSHEYSYTLSKYSFAFWKWEIPFFILYTQCTFVKFRKQQNLVVFFFMFTAFMGAKGHKNMSHLSCCDTKSYKQEGKNNSMFVKTFWHVKVDDL